MSYYYLIASLPQLSLDDLSLKLNASGTLDLIQRNLSEEDLQSARYLVYPNDNKNLYNFILEKYHKIPVHEVLKPSIFFIEELKNNLKTGSNLPDYMSEFLTKYRSKLDLLRPSRIEEYLGVEFYNSISKLESGFVYDYFEFDKTLRQLTTIHNSRLFEVSLLSEFVNDHINRELGLSRPKSVVSKTYPYVNELWDALESKDPIKIEKNLDMVRWSFIDNYDPISNFSNNSVFGWLTKFLIWTRWKGLSKDQGKERFIELSDKAIEASGVSELDSYDER